MDVRDISPLAGPVLDRLAEALGRDPRFVGLTLGGSAGDGTADRYSDLDLVLVCRDAAHAELLAGMPELAAGLGPLLASFTGEHVGEPRLLVCLYGPPLLHVDLKLVGESGLAERVEDGVVLWQRDGAVDRARAGGEARWPDADRQWIEDRFWVWIHYGAAKVARGELFECLDVLAAMRSMVLGPLLAVRAGGRPQGVRRIERQAPEAVEALALTLGGHDLEACLAALAAAAGLYREVREEIESRGAPPVRRSAAEAPAMAYLAGLP